LTPGAKKHFRHRVSGKPRCESGAQHIYDPSSTSRRVFDARITSRSRTPRPLPDTRREEGRTQSRSTRPRRIEANDVPGPGVSFTYAHRKESHRGVQPTRAAEVLRLGRAGARLSPPPCARCARVHGGSERGPAQRWRSSSRRRKKRSQRDPLAFRRRSSCRDRLDRRRNNPSLD